MPASGTVSTPALTELNAVQPTVEIGGGVLPWVYCQYVEKRTGITPGRALLQCGGNAIDVAGPVTLGRFPAINMMPYSHVKIVRNGGTAFTGVLKRRHDSGQADQVIWEAWDYRWLLSKIPILGCLVWDPEAAAVKFVTRYPHRVNPNGFRNCIGAVVPGYGLAPVFAWQAEAADRQKAVEVQDEALAANGYSRAWTPRLHLMYLCCLANLAHGSVNGSNIKAWRSIKKSTHLVWDPKSLNFAPGGDMDHVMPDTTFRGQKVLAAIAGTLKHSDTYGLRIEYYEDESRVAFYVKDSSAPHRRNLPLQRGGPATDANTIYDFDLDEDSGETAEAVVALGAARQEEGRAAYTSATGDAIAVCWTAAEDGAARRCLWGGPQSQTAPGGYCQYPQTINKLDGAWLTADGQNSRPLAKPGTPQAIALMRQQFPRWMRAFKLDSVALYNSGLLKGSDGRFADVSQFPVLQMPRPVLPAQLSYVLDENGKKTKERWPIRIEVTDGQAGQGHWHDVTAQAGLEVKEDNYLYLSGLTDENAAATELLYTGTMYLPWNMALRGIRLNLAVPTDTRVMGYAEAPGDVADNIADELEGPLEDVIDSPCAWRFEDRVNSTPIASPQYSKGSAAVPGGGTGAPAAPETYPVTGLLLDESAEATKHARQRLALGKRRRQRTSWRLIGIRPELHAGDFIGNIVVSGGTQGDADYELNAPLDIVTRDYMNQCTVAGNTPEHGGLGRGVRGGREMSFAPGAAAQGERARDAARNPGGLRDVPLASGMGLGSSRPVPSGNNSAQEVSAQTDAPSQLVAPTDGPSQHLAPEHGEPEQDARETGAARNPGGLRDVPQSSGIVAGGTDSLAQIASEATPGVLPIDEKDQTATGGTPAPQGGEPASIPTHAETQSQDEELIAPRSNEDTTDGEVTGEEAPTEIRRLLLEADAARGNSKCKMQNAK